MHLPPPLRALLRGAIDYAGLYPPAALPMPAAAARYAEYRASGDVWALGRFVVDAARLPSLAEARTGLGGDGAWPLSVLVGSDPAADAALVRRVAGDGAAFRVESVEARIASPADAARLRDAFGATREIYAEAPASTDPRELLDGLARLGVRAKIRTGGVTAEAIPSSADVARFLAACAAADVPCKATAGLHHALRGEYALTYEPDSSRAVMHGWLNVLLAAALLADGGREDEARSLLDERDAAAFEVRSTGIVWRGRAVPTAAIERTREHGLSSFGSCSFREPLDELAVLPPILATT